MTIRKRTRRHKSRIKKRKIKTSFKDNAFTRRKTSLTNRKTTLAKGIENSTPCCMCDRAFQNNSKMFTPLACLRRNGFRAHKICDECWWDPQIGFAKENALHKCPGCVRGLPLNHVQNEEIVLL